MWNFELLLLILSYWLLCHHCGIGIKPLVTHDNDGIPKSNLFYFITLWLCVNYCDPSVMSRSLYGKCWAEPLIQRFPTHSLLLRQPYACIDLNAEWSTPKVHRRNSTVKHTGRTSTNFFACREFFSSQQNFVPKVEYVTQIQTDLIFSCCILLPDSSDKN